MGMYEDLIEQLKILPVKELHDHEQVIPKNVMKLKEAMLNIGQLVDPLITDKKTKVVLDGMHRLEVLKITKIPYAVCQMVDYQNPEITIGSWFPVGDHLDKKLFDKLGFKTEKIERKQGQKLLKENKTALMCVNKDESFLVEPKKYSLDGLVEEQYEILEKLNNGKLDYIANDVIEKEIESGKSALFRKVYSKDEIIKRALEGKPYPPKSTRHLVPGRIIRMNMRLGWLHQEPKEAWEYLRKSLKNRVQTASIRRYTEPVYVVY